VALGEHVVVRDDPDRVQGPENLLAALDGGIIHDRIQSAREEKFVTFARQYRVVLETTISNLSPGDG
jgi:hypothetical protein